MAFKDRLINFRVDERQAKELEYIGRRLAGDKSAKFRYLLKLGCQTTQMLVGDEARFDYEIKTFIDNLTAERRQELLDLLLSELSECQVEALRKRWVERQRRVVIVKSPAELELEARYTPAKAQTVFTGHHLGSG